MKTIRSSMPVHALAVLTLLVGMLLLIPTEAKADTVTVAPGCEVHYDSGHASVDIKTGEVDFESPSAGANTSGCFTLTVDLSGVYDLIPPLPICCINVDDIVDSISW